MHIPCQGCSVRNQRHGGRIRWHVVVNMFIDGQEANRADRWFRQGQTKKTLVMMMVVVCLLVYTMTHRHTLSTSIHHDHIQHMHMDSVINANLNENYTFRERGQKCN